MDYLYWGLCAFNFSAGCLNIYFSRRSLKMIQAYRVKLRMGVGEKRKLRIPADLRDKVISVYGQELGTAVLETAEAINAYRP